MGQVIHTIGGTIMDTLQTIAAFEVKNTVPASAEFRPEGKIARATLLGIRAEIRNIDHLQEILLATVKEMGASMIEGTVVRGSTDDEEGISVGVILSESSAFIHLQKKLRRALVVIFTCGDTVDPRDGVAILDCDLDADTTIMTFTQVGKPDVKPETEIIER